MTVVVALVAGVVIGSLPTADGLARAQGVDLREGGTRNPGTNNALRLGGRGLAGAVLAVEIFKGLMAVWVGQAIGSDPGAGLAGVGAVAGNVYNPWFGFRGGKGLAITGGTIVAAWPILTAVLAVVIGTSAAIMRRSGPAALLTLAVYLGVAVVGLFVALPGGWALSQPTWLAVMAAGQCAVMAPKHYADAVTPSDHRASRG